MKIVILIGTLLFWAEYSVGSNIENPPNIASCQGYQSPYSVYRAVTEAIDAKHWEKLYPCLAPNDQETILKKTLLGLLVASAFDEALNKALTPVLLRHGFSLNKEKQWHTVEEDYKNINNKQKLYGDLYEVTMQHTTKNLSKDKKEPELFDLVIEGNIAHGKAQRNGDKENVIYFKKVSGSWFISTKE